MERPLDRIRSLIREVPDFPTPGVSFKDITPLLRDPSGLALAVELMANPFRGKNIEVVVGAESRGFIFGIAVAQTLSAGFIPIRKPGKLPAEKFGVDYALEYGVDRLEMHRDAIVKDQRVLVVDDLLATGGTMKASIDLIEHLGGAIVGVSVLIELAFLNGRERLGPRGESVHAVLAY
ncbi:MAG: adenine phosphoribosyltransferase [Planctomycetota bacterium]|nr:adenine phosphoribosyltransferase [Planctomycetota bacterium]